MKEEVELNPVWNACLWPLHADSSKNMTSRLMGSVIRFDGTLSYSFSHLPIWYPSPSPSSPPPALFSSCCTSELHNWYIRSVKPMGCRIQRVRKKTHAKPYKNSICTSLRCMVGTGGICEQTYFKRMKASRGPECFYSLLILDHLVRPYSAPYRDKKYIRE